MLSLEYNHRQRLLAALRRAGRASLRRRIFEENQRQQQIANMPGTKKKLSLWSKVGLDITDAAFSKLHAKESKYEDDKKKYNLEPEKFREFADNLFLKMHRIATVNEFTIDVGGTPAVKHMILKEYSRVTEAQVHAQRDLRWPAVDPPLNDQVAFDKFTDCQIKASVMGSYIHDSLTEAAKQQLSADREKFIVTSNPDHEQFFDGPSYFHHIATLVDPDNGHLIEQPKSELRVLDVKNYNYDVQKMLADYKNLRRRVMDLGGTYSEDDQFLDLWQCVRTMKEKEFTMFVKNLKDAEAMKPKATRETVDSIITAICAKQVRMITDKEWNVMSPEETMVMSLVSFIENSGGGKSKKKKKNKDSDNKAEKDSKPDSKNDSESKEKSKIALWKKTPPKDGESRTMQRNNRTYHFCKKCHGGKGMWVLHEEKDHKDGFKFNKADDKKEGNSSSKTSANNSTKSNDDPSIQVRKDLLNNAKAFLAARKDFQSGGAQD